MHKNPLEKFRHNIKGKVAIFIDAANLEKSVQGLWVHPRDIPERYKGFQPMDLAWKMDYKKFRKFFERSMNVQSINFYTAAFTTTNHQAFLTLLNKLDIIVIKKPLKIFSDHSVDHPHRKANFDVEISVDATYNMPNYDTFILFSGDSDFVYLLKFLQANGKQTILFSRKGHVAKELFSAINCYFDVLDFRYYFLKIAIKKPKIPLSQDSAVDAISF